MEKDVNTRLEELKKERKLDFYKSVSSLIVPIATTFGYAITNTAMPKSTFLLCVSYSLGMGYFELAKDRTNYWLKEQSILKESKEYKELKEKYDLFLNEFTSFIKEYKLDDALAFNLLVSDLLKTGYFSYSGAFEYEKNY